MELYPKIHVTPYGSSHSYPVMRPLLALLALLGLLMTPVAASAGAAFCFGHGGEMAAMAKSSPAHHTEHAADHSCCDEDGAPGQHDSQACAQACAAMCVTPAALNETAVPAPAPLGRPHVEAVPFKAFHAHAPPGVKRPPRIFA